MKLIILSTISKQKKIIKKVFIHHKMTLNETKKMKAV